LGILWFLRSIFKVLDMEEDIPMRPNQPLGQRSKRRIWSESVQTWFLLVVTSIGLLIALASVYSPIFDSLTDVVPLLKSVNLTALLLLVFSTLGMAISLERYEATGKAREEAQQRHAESIQATSLVQRTIEQSNLNLGKEIADIHQTLTSAITSKPLIGYEAVYEEALRLIKGCKGSEIIRSTSLTTAHVGMPEYYETIARVIGQGKQRKLGMVYKTVLGFRPNEQGEPPPEYQEDISMRVRAFKENNVRDKLEMKYLDRSWFLDLLILGDEKMIIAFPTLARDPYLRLGIRISDKDFVRSIVQWYEEHLWREAETMTWTGEWMEQ
jgi:hypothetical protein